MQHLLEKLAHYINFGHLGDSGYRPFPGILGILGSRCQTEGGEGEGPPGPRRGAGDIMVPDRDGVEGPEVPPVQDCLGGEEGGCRAGRETTSLPGVIVSSRHRQPAARTGANTTLTPEKSDEAKAKKNQKSKTCFFVALGTF